MEADGESDVASRSSVALGMSDYVDPISISRENIGTGMKL